MTRGSSISSLATVDFCTSIEFARTNSNLVGGNGTTSASMGEDPAETVG
jgi:hypothetical protein